MESIMQMQTMFLMAYIRAPANVLPNSFLDYSNSVGWSNFRFSEDELLARRNSVCAAEIKEGKSLPTYVYPEHNEATSRSTFYRIMRRSMTALAAIASIRPVLKWVWMHLPMVDSASMPRVLSFPRGEMTVLTLLLSTSAQGAGFCLSAGSPDTIVLALLSFVAMHGFLFLGFYIIFYRLLQSKRPLACYVQVRPEDEMNESLLRNQRYDILYALWLNEDRGIWLSPAKRSMRMRPNPTFRAAKAVEINEGATSKRVDSDDEEGGDDFEEARAVPAGIMTINGFVMRFGIFFDNLKGDPVSYEEGARKCIPYEDARLMPSRDITFSQSFRRSTDQSSMQDCVHWQLYYNILRLALVIWTAMILGVFAVPCACEFGDDQPVMCTWPQTFMLTLLLSIKASPCSEYPFPPRISMCFLPPCMHLLSAAQAGMTGGYDRRACLERRRARCSLGTACLTASMVWKVAWLVDFLVVYLVAWQLVFLIKFRPLHGYFSAWAELATVVCNLVIFASVLLTWWSAVFRDWVIAHDGLLVGLQISGVMIQTVALLCTTVVVVGLKLQVAWRGWPSKQEDVAEEKEAGSTPGPVAPCSELNAWQDDATGGLNAWQDDATGDLNAWQDDVWRDDSAGPQVIAQPSLGQTRGILTDGSSQFTATGVSICRISIYTGTLYRAHKPRSGPGAEHPAPGLPHPQHGSYCPGAGASTLAGAVMRELPSS
ncbi:hypothetical protein CYMTET_35580 [Cymbomonas tetramitiformis]|uniref:Uncharacterized protein n=1 Tax=Cymbomonas tetramitiformis TaxID=36881 RepID=A0AAE0KNP3_9CHLO|nr:hypothetical protein CYMTET_35580 [Cymbomonas tetramitiformis]